MTLHPWLATHIELLSSFFSRFKFFLRAKPKLKPPMPDFDEAWQPFLDSCAKGLACPALVRGISQGLHLIAYQPAEDPSDSIFWRPLHLAVSSGETEAIELLVAAGVDIEESCHLYTYVERMSPLALASKMNLSLASKILLRLGASPHGRTGEGIAPLKMASYSGCPDIVKILLSAGSSPNKKSTQGVLSQGVLSWCCMGDGLRTHEECLRLLLAAGADANEARDDGTTALMWAADTGWLAGVEILIAHGANPFAVRDDGANAFMWACRNHKKDFRVPKSIVDACGRIPFSTNKDGRGILFYAASGGIPECVALVLSAGCSVHEQSALGESPLHFAVVSNSRACVELLLAAGADPNAPGNCGAFDSPLNDASHWSRADIFEALILGGGNPLVEPTQPEHQRFKSSFRNACEAGLKDALLMALDRGLAPMIANGGGARLVEVAAEHNPSISEAIRAILLSREEEALLSAAAAVAAEEFSSARNLRI